MKTTLIPNNLQKQIKHPMGDSLLKQFYRLKCINYSTAH